jgi:hypothetical protein
MASRRVVVVAQSLVQLIEEITVDGYDTGEQLTGFLTVFQDEVETPCQALLLDVEVEIVGFDLEGDERRGLVARCRRPGSVGVVSLPDVRFPRGSVAGWLHAAYRTWLDLPPFPARRPAG